MRRTSTGRPLALTRSSTGSVPKPVLVADTLTSIDAPGSSGSPAVRLTISRSRGASGLPMPTVITGAPIARPSPRFHAARYRRRPTRRSRRRVDRCDSARRGRRSRRSRSLRRAVAASRSNRSPPPAFRRTSEARGGIPCPSCACRSRTIACARSSRDGRRPSDRSQPHAARHVDEDRQQAVVRGGGRHHDDGPQQDHDQQDQRQRAQRAEAEPACRASAGPARARRRASRATSAAPNASAYPHHGRTTANLMTCICICGHYRFGRRGAASDW